MSVMADALSSASLLVAAITLVYTAWSGSIDAEAKRTYSALADAKRDEQAVTRKVLNGRARPMMVICWLVFAAFIPRDLGIVTETGACAARTGRGCSYDDVAAIFLLTQLVVVGLAIHLRGRVAELKKQVRS